MGCEENETSISSAPTKCWLELLPQHFKGCEHSKDCSFPAARSEESFEVVTVTDSGVTPVVVHGSLLEGVQSSTAGNHSSSLQGDSAGKGSKRSLKMLGVMVVSCRLATEERIGDPSLLLAIAGVPLDIVGRTSLTL